MRFVVDRPLDRTSRPGARGVVTHAVKVVVIKVGKAAADKVVSLLLPKLAAAFEKSTWSQARPEGRLAEGYQETLAAGRLAPAKAVVDRRSLLLIHGTFSNAASAYRRSRRRTSSSA